MIEKDIEGEIEDDRGRKRVDGIEAESGTERESEDMGMKEEIEIYRKRKKRG